MKKKVLRCRECEIVTWPFPGLKRTFTIRIVHEQRDAVVLCARAVRRNRISKTRCAPLCCVLSVAANFGAFHVGPQPGNSISTNYHSFPKKDKCKRESNTALRRFDLLSSLHPWRNASKMFHFPSFFYFSCCECRMLHCSLCAVYYSRIDINICVIIALELYWLISAQCLTMHGMVLLTILTMKRTTRKENRTK